ncbi:MAG: riboflavin synthase [Spirochaetia bacterium]|nr:riboflavin synthase [Spirochaetia bacterium]
MFTGLIEATGRVSSVTGIGAGVCVAIEAGTLGGSLSLGDSVAVNGVCQTVVAVDGPRFSVDAVGDTLTKTTLGKLAPGNLVNLERARRLDNRLDGHIVLGHVNGVGRVVRKAAAGSGYALVIECPPELCRYLVAEGSVAVDGISLTIAERTGRNIRISVIPHTASVTTLARAAAGDRVNLEVDILAKYVESILACGHGGPAGDLPPITEENLLSWGYR